MSGLLQVSGASRPLSLGEGVGGNQGDGAEEAEGVEDGDETRLFARANRPQSASPDPSRERALAASHLPRAPMSDPQARVKAQLLSIEQVWIAYSDKQTRETNTSDKTLSALARTPPRARRF